MKFLFVLLACVFVCVIAQNPSPPQWPNSFSATVLAHRDRGDDRNRDRDETFFFRWFYDFTQMKDRIDGVVEWEGEHYFASIFFDYKAEIEYSIFYQEGLVACFQNAVNATMPRPTFANVTYRGKAMIAYETVYHWIDDDRDRRIFFQVYDSTSSRREIRRIDFHDERRRRTESWTFYEFDIGRQDPLLFNIPAAILSICNSV